MGDPKHTEASELNMAMETGGRERERDKQTNQCVLACVGLVFSTSPSNPRRLCSGWGIV